MRTAVPEFFARFACRAAACRHSCCRGWEIDVDDGSAALYRELPGALGEALREALFEDGEGWHFRLDEEARCPLLRRDGLCRLIDELGEDALCDICALHPRFYTECGDWELCGLGLSCEAAAALLLESDEPLRFLAEGEAMTLPALLARLGVSLPAEALRYDPCPDRARYGRILTALAATEPIDAAWTEELAALAASLDELLPRVRAYARRCSRGRYERILAYLLYRRLGDLPGRGIDRLLAFARDGADYVFLLDARGEDTQEHLRRWSEQIEYSTENVGLLLDGGRKAT